MKGRREFISATAAEKFAQAKQNMAYVVTMTRVPNGVLVTWREPTRDERRAGRAAP